MSTAQEKFYWSLWAMARKSDPATDRKALHAKLGLPESHHCFSQANFDAWKSHCLAAGQPANYKAQVVTAAMPRTRMLWLAERLCEALGQEVEYAIGTVRKMNREGGLGPAELTLESLSEEQLEKLLTALRKACRRQWPTKPKLIGAICNFCRENEIEDRAAYEAAAKALNTADIRDLEALHWDKLIVVMAAVRGLTAEVPF